MLKLRNLFIIIVFGFTTSLLSDNSSTTEADLKSAYIYNFARYTKWEGKAATYKQFTICVYKESKLYESLKKLEKKKMKGMEIKIVIVGDEEDCLPFCHIVFIPKLQQNRLAALITKAAACNALTISDTEGYAQKGVIINLKTVSNKITFEANTDQAHKSKLKMSSSILKMATIVHNN